VGETSFDEAGILAEAREETGLHDLGSGWLPGLRMLLRTYDENPFHEGGRARNRRQLVRLLATRLRVEAAFRRHPEIRQRELGSPLVLTGFPRSGTSALFNLLAVHRDARALLNWETQYPDPLEGLPPDAPDPRRDALEAGYARGRARSPEFVKIHFASADTPEECVLLQALALHGMQRGIEALLEPYASWYRSQDLSEMYA
jgi:hypothetical protein